MASKDNDFTKPEEPRNRFDPDDTFQETMGDQARYSFREFLKDIADDSLAFWDNTGKDDVKANTKCLLDLPYLWLKHGDALEVVSSFEGWIMALFGCLEELLDYCKVDPLIALTCQSEDGYKLIAREFEGFNHPALQRSTFEMLQRKAQVRRDRHNN